MKKALYPILIVLVLFASACSGGSRSSSSAKNYDASTKATTSKSTAKPAGTSTYSSGLNGVSGAKRPVRGEGASGMSRPSAVKTSESAGYRVPVGKSAPWTPKSTSEGYTKKVHPSSTGAPGLQGPTGPTGPSGLTGASMEILPKAGQITAAEWNDLHNWQDWNKLIAKPEFKNVKDSWDIELRNRFSVFVTNEQDLPVVDAEVQLYNEEGQIIWEAKTDNAGKAELWNGIGRSLLGYGNNIKVNYAGESHRISKPKTIQDGVNNLKIPVSCNAPAKAELMFVVDATGSMGDEIAFLKSELGDVLQRVQGINDDLTLKVGSVFYRDQTDKYVTRVSGLNADFAQTTNFIREQNAAGGGDYPEAVEEGLAQAINQNWSEEAVARIVFLFLDAPPHDNDAAMGKMRAQIELAAQKGIKIVPVSASGINRQTEFLLKYASIITNGTYLFITDDSGIGNPHLAPVVSDFKVEFLNDALVRIIKGFTRQNSCEQVPVETEETASEESVVTSSEETDLKEIEDGQGFDHEINSWMDQIVLYPNPANQFVNVKTPRDLDRVEVLGASGIILITEQNVSEGSTRIDISPLVDGMYFLQCYQGDRIETKKLVKKRGRAIFK